MFSDEVVRFLQGPHDDQIDSISLAVVMMKKRRRMRLSVLSMFGKNLCRAKILEQIT